MKKICICCFAALCMVLSGCAGNPRENQKTEPQKVVQNQESGVPPQMNEPHAEPSTAPADDIFSGKWRTMDDTQYFMDICGGNGSEYVIEIVLGGGSRRNTVWQVSGAYDDIWEGIAYVGAKYEEFFNEDGTVERIPVPEREEVTGLIYFEEYGDLHWIDDFDHAGDNISFIKG